MSVYPGALDSDTTLYVARDYIQTTLLAAQAIGDTVLVLTSGTGWAVNMIVSVGTRQQFQTGVGVEQELVTAVAGNILTVTRAFGGTTEVAHPASTSLATNNVDAAYQSSAKSAIIAIETALGINMGNVGGSSVFPSSAYSGSGTTSGIQEAINAAAAAGGGIVQIPRGIIMSTTITIPNGVPMWIRGSGVSVTTVKLSTSTNADLVTNANFSALTLGGTAPAGMFQVMLSDLTLDGNKANQSGTSWCFRTYGHCCVTQNLIAQNGLSGGIYSEYATNPSLATTADNLENIYLNIRTIFNGGPGWLFRGPHDSYFANIASYGNSGHGFDLGVAGNYNGGGCFIQNIDTYNNVLGGIRTQGAIFGSGITGSSGTGIGFEMLAGCQTCEISGVFGSVDNSAGLVIRGTNHNVSGEVNTSGTVAAVVVDVAQQCTLNLAIVALAGDAVQIVNDQGCMTITGTCDIPTSKQLLTGTLLDGTSYCNLRNIQMSVPRVVIKGPNVDSWRHYTVTKDSGNFVITGGSGITATVAASGSTIQNISIDVVANASGAAYVTGLLMKTAVAATGTGTATATFGNGSSSTFFLSSPYNLKTAVGVTNFAPSTGALANIGTPSYGSMTLLFAITVDTAVSSIADGFSIDIWARSAVLA